MSDHHPLSNRAVLILGMHRSGTSCLAGSLQEAGLHLGPVNTAAPHNAKGNRESRAIMSLQDDLLQANGGSWDDPPARVIWRAEHRTRRDAIIATYPADAVWGFKDPRTLLTLPGWLEALPAAQFVGTYRHPLAVAASLKARNGIGLEKSLSLWMAYNHLLLDYHARFAFPLVCFDWPAQRYQQRLLTVIPALNLTVPSAGLSFFEAPLRKNEAPEAKNSIGRLWSGLRERLGKQSDPSVVLPAQVEKLYERLREISA